MPENVGPELQEFTCFLIPGRERKGGPFGDIHAAGTQLNIDATRGSLIFS